MDLIIAVIVRTERKYTKSRTQKQTKLDFAETKRRRSEKNISFSKTYRAGGDNISFSPFDYAFCDSGAIKCDIVIKNSE